MTKRKGQKDKQHNGQRKMTKGQAKQWPKENDRRTSNTMTKRKGQKYQQHNGQKKEDRRTSNTMAKRKRTEGQATQ
jgi:hypothetical protein